MSSAFQENHGSPATPRYAAIFQAVKDGDVRKVSSLIDADESLLDITDSNQSTPLTRAFAFGQIDLALSLIERGANLFAMNHSDKWGLRYIVEKDGLSETDRARFVESAIAMRPDIAEIFHGVWRRDHKRAAEILARDSTQTSVRLADPNGANGFYNSLPYCGLTPLHHAVIAGDKPTVRMLLEAGAEVDAVPHTHEPDSRHTPMYLVPDGCGDIAQLLIDHGANPNHSTLYLSEGSDAMRQVVVANGAGGGPLLRALILKDFDKAADLIRDDPSVINERLPNSRIDTPLHMAAQAGNTHLVEFLLDQGMNVDTPTSQGFTALAMAPEMYCSFDMIKLLIERGADVRAGNDSPFKAAAWQHAYGHENFERVIRLLAAKGSRPRGLVDCARAGNLNATKLLLELGADVNETDERGFYGKDLGKSGHTALDYCTGVAGDHEHPEVAMLLREHGAKSKAELSRVTPPMKKDKKTVLRPAECPEGCPPETWRLFCAAANGDLEYVQTTIAAKPDLMHEFLWYESPLHYAVRENRVAVVRAFLDAGINPAYSNFTYSSWQSLLPIAKDRGFDEIHAMLVAEMQQRFSYDPGYEPLWKAIVAGDVGEVRKLIEATPKLVNIGDEHGNRAIHWAILARRIPIVQMLLGAEADINAKRADMQSPLHLALDGDYWFGKKNHPDPDTTAKQVAKFIRDNGAEYEFSAAVAFNDLDHVMDELTRQPDLAKQLDDSRRSPLYIAARRGHLDLVRLLLDHGADPNLSEHCAAGGRALFEASARNDVEMMMLLIEHGANADAYVDSCGNCLSIAQQGGEREAEAVELLKQNGAMPGEWKLDSTEKVSAALDDDSFIPNQDMWSSVIGKILELDDVELLQKYVTRFGPENIRELNPSKGWRMPNSEAMLAELKKHGTDINSQDWYGRTFLHYAAFDETPDRAAWLVSNGANTDVIDHESGTTALGLAAWNGGLAMVNFLLQAGADAMLPIDSEWARPLSFARKQGQGDVVRRLEQEG